MRISDWSSDVCSSDLLWRPASASPTCDIMVRPNAPDRFNEEKATYVIRGSGEEGDKPDLERGAGVIRGVVRKLPVRPGVYRMLDARGDVLYVGKARALKNRVTNYKNGRGSGREGGC